MGGQTMSGPTIEELELVARHGSGPLVRNLALVKLAERRGKSAELDSLIETGDSGT